MRHINRIATDETNKCLRIDGLFHTFHEAYLKPEIHQEEWMATLGMRTARASVHATRKDRGPDQMQKLASNDPLVLSI
jgi:hypothetical protein